MKVWQSEVDGLAHRQEKRVTVVSAEQYDPDFPPGSLLAFQAWLQAIIDEVPEELRNTAEVEIESTSSYYDSHYANIKVTYRRPETDDERAERKAGVLARLDQQRQAEWAAYGALKAKFEPALQGAESAARTNEDFKTDFKTAEAAERKSQ
jgi:hypothetical protein